MKTLYLLFFVVFSFFCCFSEDLGSSMSSTATLPVAPNCNAPTLLQKRPACAFGTTYYLVAWADGREQPVTNAADIYCARIEATTGRVIDSQGILVCHAAGVQTNPSVAFDGTNFLVVWEDFRNRNDYDVYGARVSESGQLLDATAFPISAKSGSNEIRPSVAFASGNYFVVWADARQYPVYGIYGARVTTSGAVQDADGIALDVESASAVAAAVPSNGRFMGSGGDGKFPWWQNLCSRHSPALASNGSACLLTYSYEKVTNSAKFAVIDPATGSFKQEPKSMTGVSSIKDVMFATVLANGKWAVNAGIMTSGWTSGNGYQGILVDTLLQASYPTSVNLTTILGDGKSGRGANFSYKTGAGRLASSALLAEEYNWNDNSSINGLGFKTAIVLNRMSMASGALLESGAGIVLDQQGGSSGIAVGRPALCNGPNNECLLVYQRHQGLGNCLIVSKIIREK